MNIVITGAGIVSAIGIGKAETLQSLLEERTGIAPLRYLHTGHRDFLAGEVKLSDEDMKQRLGIDSEPTTRTSLMGMMALGEALAEADLWDKNRPCREALSANMALVSGTTVGGMDKSEQYYLDFLTGNSRDEYIRTHDCGACTEMIAGYFGRFGMLTTLSTACSSAANAVILGAEMLRAGEAECVVVGGSECITKFHLNGFNSLMILDQQPCRPFDEARSGINLGEGAAWLVIETSAHAEQRGATPLARLAGYGNACDAFHQTATSANGEGPYLAMKQAVEMGGISPDKVGYINAHGTGTGNNDVCESVAIRRLFGDSHPPFSSTKAFTGHTTSASGTIEAAICLLAMQHSFLPVNLRFASAGECLTPVCQPTTKSLRYVLSNAFGFGGNDSALLFADCRQPTVGYLRPDTAKKVFLLSATQISAQEPLCEDWKENTLPLTEPLTRSREADYKRFIPPLEARRMGRILKRAIATAGTALAEAHIPTPDAIITGTGLGCIENTEIFLDALCRDGEDLMMPTRFMQSTHNTISSIVAITLHAHGYNATYSHNTVSFQSALYDAFLQLRRGAIGNALVCAHDEMTPSYHQLLARQNGFLYRKHAAECSAAMMLATEDSLPAEAVPMCEIAAVRIMHTPSDDELSQAIGQLTAAIGQSNVDILTDPMSNIFGTSFTAPALDLYAVAHTSRTRPAILIHSDPVHTTLIAIK